jgi:hypothetical protein
MQNLQSRYLMVAQHNHNNCLRDEMTIDNVIWSIPTVLFATEPCVKYTRNYSRPDELLRKT